MTDEIKRKRGQRGPGKNPAKILTHLRLPPDVVEFYKAFPNFSAKMRDVLTDYANANR